MADFVILGIMKTWLFMLTAALVVVLCPLAGESMENLAIKNPVGSSSSTIPQSSISDGLVSTPNPFDTDGNLLVTGNVRRGMHFRGSMPYQSPTSFNSSLGSSTLSSFLRDSAGPEDMGTRPAGYGVQPYYSATETVTTMRPGRSEVVLPASAMMSTRIAQDARPAGVGVTWLDASLAEPMPFGRGSLAADSQLRGPQPQYHLFQESGLETEAGFLRDLSLNPADPGRLTSSQTGSPRQGGGSAIERLLDRNEQADSRTQRQSLGVGPERREGLSDWDAPLQYPSQGTSVENLGAKSQTQMPAVPITDARQAAAADLGASNSAETSPSTVPTLRDGSTLLKGTDWAGTQEGLNAGSAKLLSADYGDSAKTEPSGTQAGTGDTSATGTTLSSQASFDRGQRDALAQVRRQLDVLTRSLETRVKAPSGDAGQTASAAGAAKLQATQPASQVYRPGTPGSAGLDTSGSGGALSLYEPQMIIPRFGDNDFDSAGRSGADSGLEPSGPAGAADSSNKTTVLEELGRMSRAEIAGEARRVKGPHTSLESLSDTKFNQHIGIAEEHLRAGRYYQAADTFSLAAVYKPDHPAILVGKSHALFAAGEYVSSALFLSRALAAYPEYLRVQVDLTAILGGQDKMARRFADIEQWYARSGSGELQFLLSYVYYRTGRLTEANRAVEAAYQKMPQSPAVQTMKTAITAAAR